MEATVAERGQITLPKAVRDALGLTKGTTLTVELDGGRIILRKDVDDALSQAARPLQAVDGLHDHRRGHARDPRPRPRRPDLPTGRARLIAIDSSVLIDLLIDDPVHAEAAGVHREALASRPMSWSAKSCVGRGAAPCSTRLGQPDGRARAGSASASQPSTRGFAPVRAGARCNERFRAARRQARSASVADFLIGAHALLQCERADHPRRRLLPRLLQGAEGHRAESS